MPSIDIEDGDKITSAFDRTRKVQGVYSVQNEKGERTRVVLTPGQKENLQPLKEHCCRYKSRDEIKSIIENPIEYFDADQFDLSEFYSDRVIEIGVYKPKFYPFICPYKSCWVAGATIECPENGTTKLTIAKEFLIDLEHLIDEANKNNKEIINYKGTSIDVKDASFLANIARKQLDSPDEPINPKKDSNILSLVQIFCLPMTILFLNSSLSFFRFFWFFPAFFRKFAANNKKKKIWQSIKESC